MKLKSILAASSALALLATAGAALGDSNKANVVQTGTNNTASATQSGTNDTTMFSQNGDDNSVVVSQTGKNNVAGRKQGGLSNAYATNGSGYGYMIQDGASNTLNITQTGNANGLAVHSSSGNAVQDGDYNEASIVQHAGTTGYDDGGNKIWNMRQISAKGVAVAPAESVNKLAILQQGAIGAAVTSIHNVIRSVVQTDTGGGQNLAYLEQTGGDYHNSNDMMVVTQTGFDNALSVKQVGERNHLARLTQTGSSHFAELSESGRGNSVLELSQGMAAADTNNSATISLAGNYNGNLGVELGGYNAVVYGPRVDTNVGFSSGSLAEAVGIDQAKIIQQASNQYLSYTVGGDYNLFAFRQVGGDGNSITGKVTGNTNEVAILQDGDGNLASFDQTGVGNDLGISQTGNGNNATVNATGDDNMVGVTQIATAVGINMLNVDIFGSNNGGGTFTVGGNAASLGLDAGTIYQENDGGLINSIDLDVGDSGTPLSANLFALKQVGTGNTIIGKVEGGNANEVAVLQSGNSNTANFTQSGGGNNISISQ